MNQLLPDELIEGGWNNALEFACDLTEKGNLIHVFSIALGFLSSKMWKNLIEEAKAVIRNRGFVFETADTIRIVVGALKRIAKESRSEGLDAAKDILGETDYRKITAGLEMETSSQIAEKQALYETKTGKMSQRGLFD